MFDTPIRTRLNFNPQERVEQRKPEPPATTPQPSAAPTPQPAAASSEPARPELRTVTDTRTRVRQQEEDLRRRFELHSNANVVDRNFRAFDAAGGGDKNGAVSRGTIDRLASGDFDRDAVRDQLREDGVKDEELDARIREMQGAATYFKDHRASFDRLETAYQGGDPDGTLSVDDVDRFTLDLREELGTAATSGDPAPTAQELENANTAYEQFGDPDRLKAAFRDRPLGDFTPPELRALAKLNAEDPKLRTLIGEQTRETVNRANTLDELPRSSAFQLLLADHVIGPKGKENDRLIGLVDSRVREQLSDTLEHRKGDDDLKLSLQRFTADMEDLAIENPLLRKYIADSAEDAIEDEEDRFTEISQADDSGLEKAGRAVGGAIRDGFNWAAGEPSSIDRLHGDPLGFREFGRDLTRGAGEGLAQIVEGGTFVVANPIDGGKGIVESLSRPDLIVKHYLDAGKEEGAGFAIGQLAVDAFGFKGAGRGLKSARDAFRREDFGAPNAPDAELVPNTPGRALPDLDNPPALEGRRLSPNERGLWNRLVVDRFRPREVFPEYRDLPRAGARTPSGDFLQPNVPGYTPDRHFAAGMGEAIDNAQRQLAEARKNGDVTPEQLREILGGIGAKRRDLAEDAYRRDPSDPDLAQNRQHYGRPLNDHERPPEDIIFPDNRHAAFLTRAQELFDRQLAEGLPTTTVNVKGVDHQVSLSTVWPVRKEDGTMGMKVVHPEIKDMKLLEARGYELMAEVMNNKKLTEAQAVDKMAEANFLFMHGTPFLRGSPASVEALNDAVMRQRFGKTFPPKTPGVEPFFEAVLADPTPAGMAHFKGNFRSYYSDPSRGISPTALFGPYLGASVPLWDEQRKYQPDT